MYTSVKSAFSCRTHYSMGFKADRNSQFHDNENWSSVERSCTAIFLILEFLTGFIINAPLKHWQLPQHYSLEWFCETETSVLDKTARVRHWKSIRPSQSSLTLLRQLCGLPICLQFDWVHSLRWYSSYGKTFGKYVVSGITAINLVAQQSNIKIGPLYVCVSGYISFEWKTVDLEAFGTVVFYLNGTSRSWRKVQSHRTINAVDSLKSERVKLGKQLRDNGWKKETRIEKCNTSKL